MVADLSSLKPKFEPARHHILTNSYAPSMKETFRRL